ncbi:MAG: hypothetical protein ABIJ56_17990 [Pseudomonadota bacterium]
MSAISFTFNWEDPGDAKGEELRATWASLQISVDNEVITRVEDLQTKSVRPHIYIPLYPLAEWIAENWWTLTNEVEAAGRSQFNTYMRRHNLRCAREGFSLPELMLKPTGSRFYIAWKPAGPDGHRVRFLSEGTEQLDAAAVVEELRKLVSTVIDRLETRGIMETPLNSEWEGVKISESDEDEKAFCVAAASLGLDPYDIQDEERDTILEAAGALDEDLAAEFFASADSSILSNELNTLRRLVAEARAMDSDLAPLRKLKKELAISIDQRMEPWNQGYEIARLLRRRIGIDTEIIRSMSDFSRIMNIDSSRFSEALHFFPDKPVCCDALLNVNEKESPAFLLFRQREPHQKFAFCRGLFEYLVSSRIGAFLISGSYSDRQKRNRAFAAEFLAPASQLKSYLSGAYVSDEQVDEIADEFNVSPYVIRHQLENHNLATVLRG